MYKIRKYIPLQYSHCLAAYLVEKPWGLQPKRTVARYYLIRPDEYQLKLQLIQRLQTMSMRMDKKMHDALDRYKKYFDSELQHTPQVKAETFICLQIRQT